MKQKFARFMYGRYGMDELSKFLTYVGLILLVLSVFLGQTVRSAALVIAVLMVAATYLRTFSKKIEKRRAENVKFMKLKKPVSDSLKLRRDMWTQRKAFKFFKCPSCKAVLRVPKGKGKLRVVCKKCGTAFEKKT